MSLWLQPLKAVWLVWQAADSGHRAAGTAGSSAASQIIFASSQEIACLGSVLTSCRWDVLLGCPFAENKNFGPLP